MNYYVLSQDGNSIAYTNNKLVLKYPFYSKELYANPYLNGDNIYYKGLLFLHRLSKFEMSNKSSDTYT